VPTDIEILTSERLESARKLINDYNVFLRSRPDLPQGHIRKLSVGDRKKVADAFALERARPMLEELTGTERRRLEMAILTGKRGMRAKPKPS
jgi:hypothetical protein